MSTTFLVWSNKFEKSATFDLTYKNATAYNGYSVEKELQLKSLDEGHRARKTVQKSEQKRASIFLKIIQCHAVHGKPIGVDSEKTDNHGLWEFKQSNF